MPHFCPLPQTMIFFFDENTIIWRGSLVSVEGCDLLLNHLGDEETNNY